MQRIYGHNECSLGCALHRAAVRVGLAIDPRITPSVSPDPRLCCSALTLASLPPAGHLVAASRFGRAIVRWHTARGASGDEYAALVPRAAALPVLSFVADVGCAGGWSRHTFGPAGVAPPLCPPHADAVWGSRAAGAPPLAADSAGGGGMGDGGVWLDRRDLYAQQHVQEPPLPWARRCGGARAAVCFSGQVAQG